jgi:hypothetical protein
MPREPEHFQEALGQPRKPQPKRKRKLMPRIPIEPGLFGRRDIAQKRWKAANKEALKVARELGVGVPEARRLLAGVAAARPAPGAQHSTMEG